MKASEILMDAVLLISIPDQWTQRSLGRAIGGVPIGPMQEGACSWCSLGAIARVSDDLWGRELARDYLSASMPSSVVNDPRDRIAHFNDNRTHAEVLDAFDRAITSALEAGQ